MGASYSALSLFFVLCLVLFRQTAKPGASSVLERGLDDPVRLHGGEDDVEDPEENEDNPGAVLGSVGTAELRVAEERREPADHEDDDGEERAEGVDGHAEAEGAGLNLEGFSLENAMKGCARGMVTSKRWERTLGCSHRMFLVHDWCGIFLD